MSPIEIAAGLLLGLLAFWLLGGLVARVGGLLLVLVGAASLALDPRVGAAALIGARRGDRGSLGHWHYALRHHAYKSPLARYVFCRWAPEWLDPTRNWAVAVASESIDDEGRGDTNADPLRRPALPCVPAPG